MAATQHHHSAGPPEGDASKQQDPRPGDDQRSAAAKESRRSPSITPSGCALQRTSRCDPIQVGQWRKQLLDGTSELITRGKKARDKQGGQAKAKALLQRMGGC